MSASSPEGRVVCPLHGTIIAQIKDHEERMRIIEHNDPERTAQQVAEVERAVEEQRETMRLELGKLCVKFEATVQKAVGDLRTELEARRGKVTLNYREIAVLFAVVLVATMTGNGVPEWMKEIISLFK